MNPTLEILQQPNNGDTTEKNTFRNKKTYICGNICQLKAETRKPICHPSFHPNKGVGSRQMVVVLWHDFLQLTTLPFSLLGFVFQGDILLLQANAT